MVCPTLSLTGFPDLHVPFFQLHPIGKTLQLTHVDIPREDSINCGMEILFGLWQLQVRNGVPQGWIRICSGARDLGSKMILPHQSNPPCKSFVYDKLPLMHSSLSVLPSEGWPHVISFDKSTSSAHRVSLMLTSTEYCKNGEITECGNKLHT
jgi:hypothetical protein